MTGRLDQLRNLRTRIDLEIAREEAFQRRIHRLVAQSKIAVTTRGDWNTQVITAVAHQQAVDITDITGSDRRRHVTDARHIAAWILRQDDRTYPQIGAALNKDHTTIISGVRRIESDPELLAIAAQIRDGLTSSASELSA